MAGSPYRRGAVFWLLGVGACTHAVEPKKAPTEGSDGSVDTDVPEEHEPVTHITCGEWSHINAQPASGTVALTHEGV